MCGCWKRHHNEARAKEWKKQMMWFIYVKTNKHLDDGWKKEQWQQQQQQESLNDAQRCPCVSKCNHTTSSSGHSDWLLRNIKFEENIYLPSYLSWNVIKRNNPALTKLLPHATLPLPVSQKQRQTQNPGHDWNSILTPIVTETKCYIWILYQTAIRMSLHLFFLSFLISQSVIFTHSQLV